MMLILTRRWIEILLQNEHFDPGILRQIPGWGAVADALVVLGRHGRDLKRWSERLADQKQAHLAGERDRLSDDLSDVMTDVARRLAAVGIPPDKADDLDALTGAYGRLLDAIDAANREARLLGPSGQEVARKDFEDDGMVQVVPDPPGLRGHARKIHDWLYEAEALTIEIDRVDRAIKSARN